MLGQDAVKRITVIATDTGLTSLNTKLAQTDRGYNQVTASAGRAATATEAADRRMQALLRQRDRLANAGGVGGAAGMLAGDAGAFAASRIAPFIAAAATAYAGIAAVNMVIERGAELLEKYANAHRSVDRSDLTANLTSLGAFQGDTIAAAQVKHATELGTRLVEAKFTLEQFAKLHLDIVDPALKLQAAWVAIVEGIAAATRQIDGFIAQASKIPGVSGGAGVVGNAFLNAIPGVGVARMGINALSGRAPAAPTADESLAAARAQLGAAMGVRNIGAGKDTQADRDKSAIGTSFAARFNAAIHDLANKAKEEAEATRNAWDRALDSVSKSIALQEADLKAVGGTAGAQARLRVEAQLTEAAQRAGIEVTGKHAEAYQKLAERAEAAANSLAKAKLNSDLRFERDQIGRSDTDATIASRLRSAGLPVDFDSAEANLIRVNEQLKIGKERAIDFASGFAHDMRNGVKATEALGNALGRLGDRLLDMAINKSISALFGSFSFTGSAQGNVFQGGNVIPFARGGVVNRPTIFPMANGAGLMGEAGPEAVLPLARGSDGNLGVRSQGGSSGSVYQDNRSFIIDARGATPDAIRMLNAKIDKLRSDVPEMSLSTYERARVISPGRAR